jgi:SAM-dependent methyltransferase
LAAAWRLVARRGLGDRPKEARSPPERRQHPRRPRSALRPLCGGAASGKSVVDREPGHPDQAGETTSTPWARAQDAEINWWKRSWKDYADIAWLRQRAVLVEAWIGLFGRIGDETRILEIGGAGMPVVDFMTKGVCHGIDPLYDQYVGTLAEVYRQATHPVQYRKAQAEATGLADDGMDIVLMMNVLDHVENPWIALDEIRRILAPGGLFVMSVDTMSSLWVRLRRWRRAVIGRREGDVLHPHLLTESKVVREFSARFTVVHHSLHVMDSLSYPERRNLDRGRWKRGFREGIRQERRLHLIGRKGAVDSSDAAKEILP